MIRITVQNALRHMLLENQMQAHLHELKKELNVPHSALEAVLNNIEIIGPARFESLLRVQKVSSGFFTCLPTLRS